MQDFVGAEKNLRYALISVLEVLTMVDFFCRSPFLAKQCSREVCRRRQCFAKPVYSHPCQAKQENGCY
jgi:hypothetical protein